MFVCIKLTVGVSTAAILINTRNIIVIVEFNNNSAEKRPTEGSLNLSSDLSLKFPGRAAI